MSASCNARHWISRLHTEPMINASATVRMNVLRCSRRHCHHHTTRPSKNAAALPRHLHGLKRVQRHDARPDRKRLVADVENFREQKRLAGLRQFDAERTNAGNGRRRGWSHRRKRGRSLPVRDVAPPPPTPPLADNGCRNAGAAGVATGRLSETGCSRSLAAAVARRFPAAWRFAPDRVGKVRANFPSVIC